MISDTLPRLAGWVLLAGAGGFGALGLAIVAFAELIPAAVCLGTGALGVGLLFGDRLPEE